MKWVQICLVVGLLSSSRLAPQVAAGAELVLHNAKVVTVDDEFSIHQAVAVADGRIIGVGSNEAMLMLADEDTETVDLGGKMLLPGLIDSHVHPTGASTYELDHPIPVMRTIEDVLDYVQSRAEALEDGQWIRVSQVFITRLKDQRFPTREELDEVAPKNPVFFRTGPDAALNSLALGINGIDEDFRVPDGHPSRVERDPETGKPTGIIRGAASIVQTSSSDRTPTRGERLAQLRRLLADYISVGITSISDRNASDNAVELYRDLRDAGELSCRVYLYYGVNGGASLEEIESRLQQASSSELHRYDDRLWLRGVKLFLDGGMLTGSAYMREPWGVSRIYGISDPSYRGVLNIPPEKLYKICRMALAQDLQITAHSVGDGAVQTLVDAYARIDRDDFPVQPYRPCVTHCNFLTPEAIDTMGKLGIVADLQPAWLWLDGRTLIKQFGRERMRLFQPYQTLLEHDVVVGGGSDHMQKIGSMRSVNPYNPFLGMWITLARKPRGVNNVLTPSESINREQAIRLYTINNAYLTFEEEQKGSLEEGKLADMIVLDRDLLTCSLEELRNASVLRTYVGGELVYQR